MAVAGAGLFGEAPPGEVFAEHFFAAASVDDAVAHNAGSGDVVGGDEGLAAGEGDGVHGARGRGDEAATAGCGLVGGGVAGAEEGGAFFYDEGDGFAELEGAGEEGVVSS